MHGPSDAGGSLTSITFSVDTMELSGYFAPTSASPPAPATFIEIEAVTFDFAFLPQNIDELSDGEHGSVALRKIPNHNDQQQALQLINWMEDTIVNLPDLPPFINRRNMSLIHRAGPLPQDETDRVNCFEIWPHELYLFNPAKAYPTAYLVDISITTEFCEDG